jgi:Lar family restriction alleviation protein
MTELKPCSFCGGVGALWSISECKTVYAICMKCGTQTIEYKSAEQAVAAWNRRAQEPENRCDNCQWKYEKRHQKCNCCKRNRSMKDNFMLAY